MNMDPKNLKQITKDTLLNDDNIILSLKKKDLMIDLLLKECKNRKIDFSHTPYKEVKLYFEKEANKQLFKWKAIRNTKNEIIKYQLTDNICIDKRYENNKYNSYLIVNGKCISNTLEGKTLKNLKRLGEDYIE